MIGWMRGMLLVGWRRRRFEGGDVSAPSFRATEAEHVFRWTNNKRRRFLLRLWLSPVNRASLSLYRTD